MNNADLIARLEAIKKLARTASIGSCSCQTKSPDIQWHRADCRYVLLQYILAQAEEAADDNPATALEAAQAELAEARAEVARLSGGWVLDRAVKAEADRNRLSTLLDEAVAGLTRITWVLDDERGAMEAQALAYARTLIAKLEEQRQPPTKP